LQKLSDSITRKNEGKLWFFFCLQTYWGQKKIDHNRIGTMIEGKASSNYKGQTKTKQIGKKKIKITNPS